MNALMDDFVNLVNRRWSEPVPLAAYVLWRLDHPFGNGRAARAAFVLCVKVGGWLGGGTILPERLRACRDEYVRALEEGDKERNVEEPDLTSLRDLIWRLLSEQISEPQ